MTGHLQNLKHKVFGDRRDQRQALRDAGFADEKDAARWGRGVLGEERPSPTGTERIRALRAARPDLTLATTRFIARQVDTYQA